MIKMEKELALWTRVITDNFGLLWNFSNQAKVQALRLQRAEDKKPMDNVQ
jgi:hypothetical protein